VIAITDRRDPADSESVRGPEDPGDPRYSREPPTQREVNDEIAGEILRIHQESYGAGAGEARAVVTDGWVLVILDDLVLLPNERFLVESGKHDAVAHVRTQYQHAIQSSFRAAIERATGREVVGYASTSSVEEPRFAAEIFKLA
jgi:uncharacterized protein YbcI